MGQFYDAFLVILMLLPLSWQVTEVFTHSDCILTDEARETPSAVPDRELCAILNVRA